MTAADEDKILSRNPCRIRGAGDEQAPERPVLTVAQVFELAERVGRRPLGNVRQVPGGPLPAPLPADMARCARRPRSTAVEPRLNQALWKMAGDGRADCRHDTRYRALVLLATFASLRWGEVIALRRCDLDLEQAHRAGTRRLRRSARPANSCSGRRSPGRGDASSAFRA